MFALMIGTGPKFYTVPSPAPYVALRSSSWTWNFYAKVFRTSLFPNPMMDLVHVWYDDRYWSTILHSTIPNPIHDLKVKVRTFMLKFYVKVFRTSLFPNPVVYLFHVRYDRCWSKILYSTIPNPVHDFKVKVTDFCIEICV